MIRYYEVIASCYTSLMEEKIVYFLIKEDETEKKTIREQVEEQAKKEGFELIAIFSCYLKFI